MTENQIILDPGSHPATRDLAGMTNYDTASYGGGRTGKVMRDQDSIFDKGVNVF
jgi:hypothetical protein